MGHVFTQATGNKEILLHAADLSIEEIIRLVDQADEEVGDYSRGPGLIVGAECLD